MQLFASIYVRLADMPDKSVGQMPPHVLEDEYDRFKVWSGNLGARHSGHASLDWRLRDAETMSTSVLKLLEILEDHLENSKQAL